MKPTTRRVLAELVRLNEEMGLPVTIRELASAAGFAAHQGVMRHVEKLEQDGALTRTRGAVRSIQPTAKGKKLARSYELMR